MERGPSTERRHPRSRGLDRLPTDALLRRIFREDRVVPRAVAAARPAIRAAVEGIVERLRRGGRLFLVGAGTSGRLAALEAAECPPTFGTSSRLVRAVVAGGRRALTRSVEGAEDDAWAGAAALAGVRPEDCVVGIAASGRTPFVRGALRAAGRRGAFRIFLSGHATPPALSDVRIVLRTGPEIVAGSTRLKAGSAAKMALNALTVAVMTRLGRVHDGWMVGVRPSNAKLRARARRIVAAVAGQSGAAVDRALEASRQDVRTAIVMLRRGCGPDEARRILARHRGNLRPALGDR